MYDKGTSRSETHEGEGVHRLTRVGERLRALARARVSASVFECVCVCVSASVCACVACESARVRARSCACGPACAEGVRRGQRERMDANVDELLSKRRLD